VGRALRLDLGLPVLLLVAPIVELARMVPVSLSGIGLREAAFAVMLKQFGVEYSRGVLFGIVVYAVFFLFALAGGVLYGARSLAARRPAAEQPQR
jgi:hypothetical protein